MLRIKVLLLLYAMAYTLMYALELSYLALRLKKASNYDMIDALVILQAIV